MRFRNTLLTLLFGGTLGMLLLREQPRLTLEPFDKVHREFLQANPGEGRAPATALPSTVLVRMDDGDLPVQVFSDWPLSAGDWMTILQNVTDYEPKVTALDSTLTFPKAEGLLKTAAEAVPGLCLPALLSYSPADGSSSLPPALPVLKTIDAIDAIPEFKSVREPPLPGTWAAGKIDMLPAGQGMTVEGDVCRVPLLARMGDKVVPTLALRSLLAWAGVPVEEVTVVPGKEIRAGKALRIEIDEAGFFRYYLSLAPDVSSVKVDSFALTKEQAAQHERPDVFARLQGIKGSLLWLGVDDVDSRVFKLPGGTPVSSSDLTARAIAVIQTNRHLLPLPGQWQWIAPAATLMFCVWLTHWRKSRLWPGALAAAIALMGVSLWLYRRDHLWLPLAPSLGLLAATLVLSYILPVPKPKSSPESPTRRTMRTSPTRTRTRTVVPVVEANRDPSTRREPGPATEPAEPSDSTEPPAPDAPTPRDPDTEPHSRVAAEEDAGLRGETEEMESPHQLERPQRQGKRKRKRRH
jgi:hypothetical protein